MCRHRQTCAINSSYISISPLLPQTNSLESAAASEDRDPPSGFGQSGMMRRRAGRQVLAGNPRGFRTFTRVVRHSGIRVEKHEYEPLKFCVAISHGYDTCVRHDLHPTPRNGISALLASSVVPLLHYAVRPSPRNLSIRTILSTP